LKKKGVSKNAKAEKGEQIKLEWGRKQHLDQAMDYSGRAARRIQDDVLQGVQQHRRGISLLSRNGCGSGVKNPGKGGKLVGPRKRNRWGAAGGPKKGRGKQFDTV